MANYLFYSKAFDMLSPAVKKILCTHDKFANHNKSLHNACLLYTSFVNTLFSLGAMLIVFIVCRVNFNINMLWIPAILLQIYVFSVGVGFFLARDVYKRQALKNGDNAKVALKTINGKKYAFDDEGKMLYGWVSEDNAERVDDTDGDGFKEGTYYFGGEDDGAMTVGWLQMDITYCLLYTSGGFR